MNALVPIQTVPGSFRDPASRVFRHEGRIVRGVDQPTYEALRDLSDEGVLQQLIGEGLIVESEWIDEPQTVDTLRTATGFQHFLRHATIDRLTWPYEWTVSMLADAAVLTLDLQMRLLVAGYSLKDASAFNIQFRSGRPVFIDLGSIHRPQRLDIWYALGQFSQMFTFPLLLCRHAGWDLRSYFLANPGGVEVRRVAKMLGRWSWLQPGLMLDVTLPAMLTRRSQRSQAAKDSEVGQPESLPAKSSGSADAQLINLLRLRRKVTRLAEGYRPQGVWARYAQDCHYSDAAREAKRQLVEKFLKESKPRRALDLGCNTGEHSRLAAACGAEVVAVDSDHDAVEMLYRGLRSNPAPIAPMVVDICSPSPAIGFMNQERATWFERTEADCVLALALLHHLLVTGNLSLGAVAEMLHRLTSRDVVLEFIPRNDPMLRRLLEFRIDLYGDVSLDACRGAFAERFETLAEEPINGTARTLLFLRKRK